VVNGDNGRGNAEFRTLDRYGREGGSVKVGDKNEECAGEICLEARLSGPPTRGSELGDHLTMPTKWRYG